MIRYMMTGLKKNNTLTLSHKQYNTRVVFRYYYSMSSRKWLAGIGDAEPEDGGTEGDNGMVGAASSAAGSVAADGVLAALSTTATDDPTTLSIPITDYLGSIDTINTIGNRLSPRKGHTAKCAYASGFVRLIFGDMPLDDATR